MPRIAVVLALLLSAPAALAQDGLNDVRVDVVYLASDLLEGRDPGTAGEEMAASYIVSRFEELGLVPGYNGSWFQPFEFQVSSNPQDSSEVSPSRTGKNIVGWMDNGAETTVIVGAHYDHLGMGGSGSRAPGVEAVHNGADDNASGVAGMLEVARQLGEADASSNNYLFLAFSAEELGLIGSKKFVETPSIDLGTVNYMVNLDMVGRLNEERSVAVNGIGTSPAWDAAVESAALALELSFTRHESGLGPSDHASFYLEDLPVLHLFTGQHMDYHKPADDSELINYEGLLDVATFATRIIEGLDGEGRLAFTKTQDQSQSRRTSLKVTLGVMPDMVFSGPGLKIDAVMDDRPAQAAGLERGDVVVRIGDHEVGDMYSYMEALGNYEPGDVATIVVRRGEETFETEVRW